MAEIMSFKADARGKTGRGSARADRRQGRVPANIYGDASGNLAVTIDREQLQRALAKSGFGNRLCDIQLNGEKFRALPREVQVDPVSDIPIHVDFMRVSPTSRVRLHIPVTVAGIEASPGIKRGGTVNVVRHEVEFFCRADAIPETVVFSVAECDIGDSVHINDVQLPAGVVPTIRRNFTVVTVTAPTIYVEEEKPAAAETVEGVPVEGEAGAVPAEGEAAAPAEGEKAPADAKGAAGKAEAAPARGAAAPARGAAGPAKGAAPPAKGAAAPAKGAAAPAKGAAAPAKGAKPDGGKGGKK
jgi:large subunit ribosomal protein L25